MLNYFEPKSRNVTQLHQFHLSPTVKLRIAAYFITAKLGSVRFILSYKNGIADRLSRDHIHRWLLSRGAARFPNMSKVASASDQTKILKWWSLSC